MAMTAGERFLHARDFLLEYRLDYPRAFRDFRWPELHQFNWAIDYFDEVFRDDHRTALWIVTEDDHEEKISFCEMSRRSNAAANFLRALGVRSGDRVLIMLPNIPPLWELTLALMKLGAVMSPATTLLSPEDLADRLERGDIRHVIAERDCLSKFANLSIRGCRVLVGGEAGGWVSYAGAASTSSQYVPDAPTKASDPCLLYFTSGTTAKPKLVLHSHQSYPVGHLSTMYWLGLTRDDIHYNISSPGWAKHAWSSFFAAWSAGACIFSLHHSRFHATKTLGAVERCGVTTLCAPPTVWRMLVLHDLSAYSMKLRELASAGEPLNPEVIQKVRAAWGVTIRDGYGQTETTAQIGNPPGQAVKIGSMGRPLPGYGVVLLNEDDKECDDGEIALPRGPQSLGLMCAAVTGEGPAGGGDWYRTSDTATRDADGYFWYLGRADDVFKSADYRISPFELESVLVEHEAVAEAAIVPSPDPIRHCVPKAFVALKPGIEPTKELAGNILRFTRERLSPYQRIRRIEFAELPKTVSGKIRRVELRASEHERRLQGQSNQHEYQEDEL